MSAPTARSRRGVLDTSTLLLLGRIEDPEALPATPLITAVTLAERSPYSSRSIRPTLMCSPSARRAASRSRSLILRLGEGTVLTLRC